MRRPNSVCHLHGAEKPFPIKEARQLRKTLEKMVAQAPASGRLPRLYRLGTISKELDIPKATLRLLVAKGEIRAFRILSRIYLLEDDLLSWLSLQVGVKISGSF